MPVTQMDIQEQQKRVKSSQEEAAKALSTPTAFEGMLRQEMAKRDLDRGVTKLSEMASTARQNFASYPTSLNTEFAQKGIDPYQRMNEVAKARGQSMGEIKTISDLQSQQNSGIDNLIAGIKLGMEAEAQKKQALPQYEQQNLVNLMNIMANEQAAAQQEWENMFSDKEFGLKEKLTNAQISDMGRSGGSGSSLTASQELEVSQLMRVAKGEILSDPGYSSGTMSDADIVASLLSAGQDPTDPFFADLFSGNPQKAATEKQDVTSFWDRFKGGESGSDSKSVSDVGLIGKIPSLIDSAKSLIKMAAEEKKRQTEEAGKLFFGKNY